MVGEQALDAAAQQLLLFGQCKVHVTTSVVIAPVVIARSEATKQSMIGMDCFASLAMTQEIHNPRIALAMMFF